MTTHTPEPWRVSDEDHPETADEFYHYICGGKGYCDDEGNPGFEICGHLSLADAVLLAAAKDLLEALVAVVSVADRKTDEFDLAHAAIAKATGTA